MATINGQPIYMADIREILLYSYGVPIAEQLIANELVRQECQRLKVSVSDKDVAAANDKALEQMFPTLDPPQRAKGLEETLVRKNVTRKQWDFTMRRNAQLAKLAEPFIKITEDDIQQAFGNAYDRKVVVRHIQLASLAEAQDVLDRLQKGADFLQLLKEKTKNPVTVANGGWLAPISQRSQCPPAIKDTALAMTKVGQISPVVQAGEVFHILKLEQIIPPQNVRIDDVREKLRQQIHDEQLNLLQQRILLKLIQDAKAKGAVKFANPVLRELWEEAEKAKDSP